MRRIALIVGGAALGVVGIPALALGATGNASSPTFTQGHTPPAITADVSGAVCSAYLLNDTSFAGGFTPTRSTAPGHYATRCTASGTPTNTGTLTVLPSLKVARVPSVVVGGGTLPLNVTVVTPGTVTVTAVHGGAKASVTVHLTHAGRTLIGLPLVTASNHRLPGGAYTVTVTDVVPSPGSSSDTVAGKAILHVGVGAGVAGTEIALAQTGGHISPTRPLVFTYSQPVAGKRGSRPVISPGVTGRWTVPSAYSAVFTPTGFGFAPGATATFTAATAVWTTTHTHRLTTTVRNLSNARAVQLLAQLGYLPLKFTPRTPVARTPSAQANAATSAPAGTYKWRYSHTPSSLVRLWTGGRAVMIRGALMSFEVDHRLSMDGALGPQVWRALEVAAITGHGNRFGYSYVHVYRGLPQHLVVWHNGRTAYTALVNTGIAGHATNYGVFPIYLRQTVGSMSGTNPDGSHYNDSGIRWISYFSGGDALHQFSRPGYGYPQSLGCVEMTDASAHRVFQLTEYGTLVDTRS